MKNHRGQCFFGKQTKANHALSSHEEEIGEAKIAEISGSAVNPSQTAAQQDVNSFEGADDTQGDAPQATEAVGTDAEAIAMSEAPADDTNLMLSSTIRSKAQAFQRKSHKRYNAHHAHVPSDQNDLMI